MSDSNDKIPSSKKDKKKRRILSADEWASAKRILVYAYPFRAKILIALLVGMAAGLLAALNLAALIPVLSILLDKEAYEKGLSEVEDKVAGLQDQLNTFDGGWIDHLDLWFDHLLATVQLSWTKWIVLQGVEVIYYMAIALIVAQICKALLEYFSKFTLQKSFFLAVVRLKNDLYDKCLRLDMRQFEKHSSGDLLARLNNDIRAVRNVFTTMVGEAILAPFSVFFLLFLLLYLSPQLTLVVAVGLPLILLPITRLGKKLRTLGIEDEKEEARLLSASQEMIQGLLIVKTYATERRESKNFKTLSKDLANRQVRREGFRLLAGPVVEITASIAMAVVLVMGAYVVLKAENPMTPTEFLIFLGALTRFYPPVKKVSNTFVKLQKALASADRIFEVIDLEPEIIEKPDAKNLAPFQSSIEFKNVSFSYQTEKGVVLDGFSLTIAKGRKVALVGESGAGKSTVARLLPRLYEVTGGAILIDGVDIRDVTVRSLRRQIASVTQDIILFDGTVRDNIAYSNEDASQEEVIAAAKAANAHSFIMELPDGYDTSIGERGGQLSGGQKQRISIARALLANTPILILDEATSALDNDSEALVQEAIDRLMENRTVIMIAHRLSTVRKADEIIVVGGGNIVERGNHEDLLKKGGEYARLVKKSELLG